ncbi:MAG TPA: hypothetical protein VKU39_10645 [Streptosporangiaceae bacterium]|nr:hypothetical protein [Streptosporangiaceae bacterium]
MSANGKALAVLAVLAVTGGVAAAIPGDARAASSGCGSSCVSLASQAFGTSDVSAVSGGTAAGQPVVMAVAADITTEDFLVSDDGTVANFCSAGLMTGVNCTTWPSDPVFEYEYAPGGAASGLCLGTATAAVSGTAVTLQPCGVDARTVWVELAIDKINGVDPLIAGTNTISSTPLVLTAGATGAQLTTRKLSLSAGTFAQHQMWRLLTGIL